MSVKTIMTGLLMALIGVGALVFTAVKAIDIEGFRGALRLQVTAAIARDFDPGSIEVVFGWPPRLVATRASLANAAWASDRPMAQFDALEAEIDPWSLLIGSVRIRALTLLDGRIDLVRSDEGIGNWVFDVDGLVPIATPSALVGLERLTLRRVSIDWRGPGFAAGSVFRIGRADADLTLAGDIEIVGNGTWNDNPFEARLTLPGSRDNQPVPFTPRLAGKIIGVGFDIAVRSVDVRTLDTFDVDMSVEGPKLPDLGMVLGADLPMTPPFKASATMRREEGILYVDRLSAVIGETDVGGRLIVGDPEGRIRVEGELSSQRLAKADVPAFHTARLLDWIRGFDTSIDWRIDAATLGLVEAKAIAAHLESDGDRFVIEVPASVLGGGIARATARLLVSEADLSSSWEFEGSVEGSTLASILAVMELPAVADAEGAGVEFSLRGPAESLGAWLGGLSGTAHMMTGPGSLAPEMAEYVPTSELAFACLAASLEIDRGLAVAKEWLMDAGAEVIALEGSADLRGGIFDGRTLVIAVNSGPPFQARSVEINGPLSAPEATPGPGEIVGEASQLGAVLAEILKPAAGEARPCRLPLDDYGEPAQ